MIRAKSQARNARRHTRSGILFLVYPAPEPLNFATLIALPITSVGRFSPFGPLGIAVANFVRVKYPLSDLDSWRFALVPRRKDF